MTILKNSSGNNVLACDGCGREDAGPGQPLDIRPFAVNDANIGGLTQHHYCTHCAANRNSSIEVLNFTSEAQPPTVAPVAAVEDAGDQAG